MENRIIGRRMGIISQWLLHFVTRLSDSFEKVN